jgi:hypothetical protein
MSDSRVTIKRRGPLMLAGWLFILAAAVSSQSTPGTIIGVITDPEGSAFPIAFVRHPPAPPDQPRPN